MSTLQHDIQRALGMSYTVERELGGGGMSSVFVAFDGSLQRRVVVKVLPPELAANVSIERFKREIMLVAGLQHPHIVPVLAAGEVAPSPDAPEQMALPYFVMPFVEGESLRARLRRGPLSVREAVNVMRDVARALAYAHARGVIHRDIKPDNVLLSGGSAVVTDFGIAKAVISARLTGSNPRDGRTATEGLTQHGISLGTPAYMAPEQVAADPTTDHRADLYALGLVAYEMLAGTNPFAGRPPQALLAAQLTEMPSPLSKKRSDVPPALESLVMACLAKAPDERPATADAVARALDDPSVVSGAFGSMTGSTHPVTRSRVAWMVAGVGIALSLAAGGAYFTQHRGDRSSSATPSVAMSTSKAIAVLPLVSVGRDTADVYFAEGMTNELSTALSRVAGIRVASTTAAQAARDRFVTLEEMANALKVQLLLEGTVQRSGGRLRVTVRLVSAADGFTVWSDVFDREPADVFAVQDEIARAVVAAITPELTPAQESTVVATPGTVNLEAWDFYMQGRHQLRQRRAASLNRALSLFRQSVARDSTFAKAWVGIADVYGVLPLYADVNNDSVLTLGLDAVNRALAIDPSLAEGYAARGNLLAARWRWADAEADFRKALALDASDASAHAWYGEFLMAQGRVAESRDHLRRAADLEPMSPVVLGWYATALALSGDSTAAITTAQRAVQLDEGLNFPHFMLGSVFSILGRQDSAAAELETATAIDSSSVLPLGMLGYAYGRLGQAARALEVAGKLEAGVSRRNGAAVAEARVRLGMGDTASALGLLERAVARRDPSFATEVLVDPAYDPVRRSSRFAVIVGRIGLDRRVLAGGK